MSGKAHLSNHRSARCVAMVGISVMAAIFPVSSTWAQLDTWVRENEFSIRESPDFNVPPPRAPNAPFITFEAHLEGLIQFERNFPKTNNQPLALPASRDLIDDDLIQDTPVQDLVIQEPWNTLSGDAEARLNVNFGQYFSIATLLRFQRGEFPTYSTVFANQVLYAQRLFGIVHLKPVHLYAGKIHPRFGIGWYYTPGLYGTDFDSDYELLDKIGAGMRLDIRALGRHRLTVETFHTDTSFLQYSLIPGTFRTGLVTLADGGAGNTGTFESFAVALSGEKIPGLPGFSYQVGWAKQKGAPTDARDEYSWSVAGVWQFPLWENVTLEPVFEWVSVTGQGGFDRNANYLTAAATLRFGSWAGAVHTTQRIVNDFSLGQSRTDSLFGFALAYDFGSAWKDKLPWLDGFSAIVGYRQVYAFNDSFQTLGAQIKYSIDF